MRIAAYSQLWINYIYLLLQINSRTMFAEKNFSDSVLQNLLAAIQEYLFRTYILPTNICKFCATFSLFCTDGSHPLTLEKQYESSSLERARKARLCKDTYRENILNKFQCLFSTSNRECEACATVFLGVDMYDIKVSAVLVTKSKGHDNEMNEEKEEDRKVESDLSSKAFDLIIWRFVNGSPLMSFTSNDDTSCAFFEAVTRIDWTQFGHRVMPEKGSLYEDNRLKWKLQSLYKDYQSSCPSPIALYILIDLYSEKVPFQNLTKTSIVNNSEISKFTEEAIVQAMTEMKALSGNLFMSRRELKAYKMQEVYIPTLITALTRNLLSFTDEQKRIEVVEIAIPGASLFSDNICHEHFVNTLNFKLGEKLLNSKDFNSVSEHQCRSSDDTITDKIARERTFEEIIAHAQYYPQKQNLDDHQLVQSLSESFDPSIWRRDIATEAALQHKLPLEQNVNFSELSKSWVPYIPPQWSSDEEENSSEKESLLEQNIEFSALSTSWVPFAPPQWSSDEGEVSSKTEANLHEEGMSLFFS